MKLLEAYELFERWHIFKGSRPNTIETYNVIVRKMFINQYFGNIESEELTIVNVMNYVIHLRQKKTIVDNTVASYWKKIRVFLNYLYENNYSDIDWSRELKKFKTYKTKKIIYRDEEIVAIFNSIDGKSPTSWQKRLFFMLLIDTGMRIGELLELKTSDINIQGSPYIKIRGSKGYEDRILPLSHETFRIFKIHMIYRKESTTDYLFINNNNEQMTYNSVKSYVKTHIKGLGINRGNVHLFRHTTITKWLLQGNSTMLVMMWAGHRKSETTENYWHYSNELKATGVTYMDNKILLNMLPIPKKSRSRITK